MPDSNPMCVNHPDVPASKFCMHCGHPICDSCAKTIGQMTVCEDCERILSPKPQSNDYCVNHPNAPRAGFCMSCGAPLCEECYNKHENKVCDKCYEAEISRSTFNQSSSNQTQSTPKKSSGLNIDTKEIEAKLGPIIDNLSVHLEEAKNWTIAFLGTKRGKITAGVLCLVIVVMGVFSFVGPMIMRNPFMARMAMNQIKQEFSKDNAAAKTDNKPSVQSPVIHNTEDTTPKNDSVDIVAQDIASWNANVQTRNHIILLLDSVKADGDDIVLTGHFHNNSQQAWGGIVQVLIDNMTLMNGDNVARTISNEPVGTPPEVNKPLKPGEDTPTVTLRLDGKAEGITFNHFTFDCKVGAKKL